MISRYETKEMSQIWSKQLTIDRWVQIELLVMKSQETLGLIPSGSSRDFEEYVSKSYWKELGKLLKDIDDKEISTKHDFVAFLEVLENRISNSGKYLHLGLTSSDVIDTATSMAFRASLAEIRLSIDGLLTRLKWSKSTYGSLPLCSRTHGQLAQAITWGERFHSYISYFQKIKDDLDSCEIPPGKLSGPVGTYEFKGLKFVEREVLNELQLAPQESGSTQIIHRFFYSRISYYLAEIASFLDKMAQDFRIQSITGEIQLKREGSGSSSMPHKLNPVDFENISGLSRLVLSYHSLALQNNITWFERDISHSSVERVIFPDIFHVSQNILQKMTKNLSSLEPRGSLEFPINAHSVLNDLQIQIGRKAAHDQIRKQTLFSQ